MLPGESLERQQQKANSERSESGVSQEVLKDMGSLFGQCSYLFSPTTEHFWLSNHWPSSAWDCKIFSWANNTYITNSVIRAQKFRPAS